MTGPYQRKPRRRMFGAVLAVLILAGCSVGPDFRAPGFPFANTFSKGRAGAPVLLDNAAWWNRFNDPVLDNLVELALRGNLDLAIARERVTEARALEGTVPSGLSVTGSVGAQRRGGSSITAETGTETSLGFDWLLDPYGGRKAQKEAAAARIEVADAELDAARLLLLSNLVTAYVDLRYTQQAALLRQRELRSRHQTLRLVRDLLEAGTSTRLDLVRAEALVSETQALIPELEAAIRSRTEEIAVLLGQVPGASNIPLGGAGGQPQADLSSEIGIPADLLRNRPDIRIAERLYYAAIAEIGAAEAELYPTLSLTGTFSLGSFSSVEDNSYLFGPTLRLPALPNGPRQSAVEVNRSRARQAHTTWTARVLGAIRDVESALAEYTGSLASVRASRKTVRLYAETVSLTRELIASDGATVRDLLDAEQSVATARIALALRLRDLGRDFVVLNVSLGSGNGYEPPQ